MKRIKLLIASMATLAMLSGFGASAVLAADLTLPLHNDTANVGTDCPDDSGAYWHFVISPNNGSSEFVEFHLNIGGTVYDLGYTPNGTQTDNVFVAVPAGETLGDLDTTDSTADITWDGTGNQPTKFVLSHVCPGDTPGAVTAISTAVHLAGNHTTDIQGAAVPLGSTVHDSATVTSTPTAVVIPAGSSITFSFFENGTCADTAAATQTISDGTVVGQTTTFSVDNGLAQGPLGAGAYSYMAVFESGDTNVALDATGACEPFTVNKGDLTIRTDIHNAAHAIVTSVGPGSVVHDTATLSGAVAGFAPDLSQVAFTFFTNATCTGTGASVATAAPEGTLARSADSAPLAIGQYSYSATFLGDDNYNPVGPAACEPLGVRQLGKTMGFWGNKNGQALLVANNAFSAANAVSLGISGGCYVTVDSAAKSLQIFPTKLNGLGLTGCGGVNGLDAGINTNSFNVLLAQTLALSYNIKYVNLYVGQTIADLGCTAVAPLTGTSTVEQARDYANSLIGNAKSGYGTTVTQSEIGAMNTLLGCLNRES
jgi:hypothetical protein